MVTPYSHKVDGIMSEEKSLEGRIVNLDEDYSDVIKYIAKAYNAKNNFEKKIELQKTLIYLQKRIDSL